MNMTKAEAGKLGWLRSRETQQEQLKTAKLIYMQTGHVCLQCLEDIPYEKRKAKFCCKSCATKWSNRTHPKKTRTKVCRACSNVTFSDQTFCSDCIQQGRHLHIKELSDCCTDSTRKRCLLRPRPHQCQQCDLTEWRGQPIPLEMDHIDGDSANNAESNLQLICPNCHAQSPYNKGKNKGRGRQVRKQRYQDGKSY